MCHVCRLSEPFSRHPSTSVPGRLRPSAGCTKLDPAVYDKRHPFRCPTGEIDVEHAGLGRSHAQPCPIPLLASSVNIDVARQSARAHRHWHVTPTASMRRPPSVMCCTQDSAVRRCISHAASTVTAGRPMRPTKVRHTLQSSGSSGPCRRIFLFMCPGNGDVCVSASRS